MLFVKFMVKCSACHKGMNSSYIRKGAKESFRKVGLYRITCDIYYSPDLLKQYAGLQKEYTVFQSAKDIRYVENNTLLSEKTLNQAQYGTDNHQCSGRDLNPGSATRKYLIRVT
ncbi:MAG: hypothetical protein L0H53_03190 [Candidatus Nitrosocosmicus sp.]|nr:hypothetical protein [Candidatus Nitrosocosmicus sp.]MDN5868140.1 hypothetical protein [Candidatus Nitrosocosmicus sp.]